MARRQTAIDILCVDDEPEFLEIEKAFLECEGDMAVRTATSGRSVLDLVASGAFDAIVSDYQMPGLDGIELLKAIRAKYPDLPFVLFTGKGREEIAVEALRNGASSYVTKGGDTAAFKMLAHEVRSAVIRKQAEEAIQHNLSRFNFIMRSLSEIVFMLTEGGTLTYVSPSISSALGYVREDLEGRNLIELGFLDAGGTRESTWRWFSELLKASGEGLVFPVRAKSGETRKMLFVARMSEQNGSRFIIASAKDVTQLVSAQEEVAARERLLSATLDHMPIAAGILDARSHKVVHINSSLSKLLSLEPEDIVGKTPSEFGVIEDMDVDGALRLLPDSHPSLCTRTRVRRPDGTIRTYGLELLRISVEEGHFTFFIAHDLENASSTARSQGC